MLKGILTILLSFYVIYILLEYVVQVIQNYDQLHLMTSR